MKVMIDVPKEFEEHWKNDRFVDSLSRLKMDAHCLAGNYEKETVSMLIEALNNATDAADVVEVKHGKWITMSDADGIYWACSECGEDIPRISHYNPKFSLFPRLKSIDRTNFCPNCGAKMDKN